jgi:NADPH:quinone reductase-like Zn-dependent oxidoreductase
MRAAVITRFGTPDVLAVEDVPDPSPGSGQVLIDVEYAGVTFVETQVRAGHPPNLLMKPELPAILGNGVGGRIGGTGYSVVSTTGGSGGYAERVGAFTDTAQAPPDVEVVGGTALSPDESRQLSVEALDLAASGRLVATIGQEYPLERAADAHRAIQSRATVGKTLLRI